MEAEGVRVLQTEEGWRVDLRTYRWENTMEDAVYLAGLFEQAEESV